MNDTPVSRSRSDYGQHGASFDLSADNRERGNLYEGVTSNHEQGYARVHILSGLTGDAARFNGYRRSVSQFDGIYNAANDRSNLAQIMASLGTENADGNIYGYVVDEAATVVENNGLVVVQNYGNANHDRQARLDGNNIHFQTDANTGAGFKNIVNVLRGSSVEVSGSRAVDDVTLHAGASNATVGLGGGNDIARVHAGVRGATIRMGSGNDRTIINEGARGINIDGGAGADDVAEFIVTNGNTLTFSRDSQGRVVVKDGSQTVATLTGVEHIRLRNSENGIGQEIDTALIERSISRGAFQVAASGRTEPAAVDVTLNSGNRFEVHAHDGDGFNIGTVNLQLAAGAATGVREAAAIR